MAARKIVLFLLCMISVIVVAHFTDRSKIMTPEITVPYFSGAALSGKSDAWIFNLNEVDTLKKITAISDVKERINAVNKYQFSGVPDSTHIYNLNQPGLVYAIRIAKSIFYFQGEIGALKSLQLLIHLVFGFFILISFKTSIRKILFFFLYLINPAIIYLTLFPFYYFWQVIGSYILILALLNPQRQNFFLLLLTSVLLACIYHVRVSTLPLSLFVILFGFYRLSPVRRVTGLILFIGAIIVMQPDYLAKHPGHVMYSSLGAYPGSPVRGFGDNISFEDYSLANGKKYSYKSSPSMYDAEVIMGEAKWGMQQFIEFAKENPLIIGRNAVLNVLESFSFGYQTSSLLLTGFSALTGLCFLTVLFVRKKYSNIILIFISVCSYVFYLAPVPIYLYGTFIVSVYAFIDLIPEKIKPPARIVSKTSP